MNKERVRHIMLTLTVLISLGIVNGYAQIHPGKIKVFQTKGDVRYNDHNADKSGRLTRGMEFTQNTVIETGLDSRALIIFSNGSRMNIAEKTKMLITRYVQEPYDKRKGHFLTLREDPSKSDTLCTLKMGTIVGKVQKLRRDSIYDVETAIGSAGIRGTVYMVSFTKTDDGKYQMKVGNIEGMVDVTSKVPANIVIDDQNLARSDYDPTATLSTGSVPEGAIVVVTALLEDIEYDIEDNIQVLPIEPLPSIDLIRDMLTPPEPVDSNVIILNPAVVEQATENRTVSSN